MAGSNETLWIVPGVRTPFAKVDGAFADRDAVALSVPVVQAMMAQLEKDEAPDVCVWGTVAPNLGYSNIARCGWTRRSSPTCRRSRP